MEDDTEKKAKARSGSGTMGLPKTDIDELINEKERTLSDFISALPMALLGRTRKAVSKAISRWLWMCGSAKCTGGNH